MKSSCSPLTVALLLAAIVFSPARSLVAEAPRAVKPDLPNIPEKTFNVHELGAKGDGATDDTAALQATINVAIKADLPFGIYNGENIRFENCAITTPDGVNKLSTDNAKLAVTP